MRITWRGVACGVMNTGDIRAMVRRWDSLEVPNDLVVEVELKSVGEGTIRSVSVQLEESK